MTMENETAEGATSAVREETGAVREEWMPSSHDAWKLETADGYLGNAYMRVAGAGLTVTRPDGTELYRKTWGAREIFPASWPGMFAWLKGRINEELIADRAKREQP
jgi:hypothetical protein